MKPVFTEWMDRIALRTAAPSVKPVPGWMEQVDAARELLKHPDFFSNSVQSPGDLTFISDDVFQYASPLPSAWPENNVVHGRLFRCDGEWKSRPTVLLLHGWNAELAYRFQFPWLARQCNRRGLNAAMIELPFHRQRKPSGTGLNFLSGDLLRVIQATRQAIADIRALIAWLAAETSAPPGVCGFSLGAWLAGFIACYEPRNRFAVLATPVANMERAIAELPFCGPIRSSCQEARLWPRALNLVEHKPCIPAERTLVIEAAHDLFAPAETLEELCRRWGEPVLWRVAHGHISILMAVPTLKRMVDWIADTAIALTREKSNTEVRR